MSEYIERYCKRCDEVVRIFAEHIYQSKIVIMECENAGKVVDPECEEKCIYTMENQLGFIQDTTKDDQIHLNKDNTIQKDDLLNDGLEDFTEDPNPDDDTTK